MQKMPIPITILTGFLGAGKTTLLNHIIRSAAGKKIAIVENEFGETGIDAELIERSDQEIVEINNGCICCTVRKDFLDAIERLLSSGREIDYIVIEASGMSEPLPVAQSFLLQNMDGRVRLDSIICLVDATTFSKQILTDIKTTLEQIEYADFVVINKTDGVDKLKIKEISDTIRKVNLYATIVESVKGEVDIRYLLDTDRFEITPEIKTELAEQSVNSHLHNGDIHQFFYTSDKPFVAHLLKDFMDTLDNDVFRVKGFVKVKGHGNFILQRAGARMELTPDPKNHAEGSGSQLVFIGKNMNEGQLRQELDIATGTPNILFTK